jgi:ribosomal protein L11 methylase PrmA
MSDLRREPGSFRDPSSTVFYAGERVLRGLDARATDDWARLSTSAFFGRALADGRIVGTRVADADAALVPHEFATVLEHERVPFVSYPYEWTFEMLRDAARLHLELLLDALDAGMTMKDGYAFNVQWRGSRPVFVDIGSFERSGGGPWVGYRQFCRTFLYPLLLEAHLGVPYQRFLAGNLEGLEPDDMRALFGGLRRFRRGVFRHVYLHSVVQRCVNQDSERVREDLGKAGFGTELAKAATRKLLKLVERVRSKRSESAWKQYRTTCSYSSEDRAVKERFLRGVLEGRTVGTAWDLGTNDGFYARLVAETARYVVAVDADDVTVDALYRSLRQDGVDNVLPLVVDLTDPSPARGWRGSERRAFADRGAPDLVLALALVHHLAIGANVPLAEVVAWFRALGGTLVVEFVEPHDPMAKRLLANKRAGLFPDYRLDVFEQLLAKHYAIERREPLPGGSRTLFLAAPR